MNLVSHARQFLEEWLDAVSHAVDALAGRLVRTRRIRLVKEADGTFIASTVALKSEPALPNLSFRLDKGGPQPPLPLAWKTAFRNGRIEALLHSTQVMTHHLDFPKRAVDFLDGMIRAQVDRLTPWSVNDAVFGWSLDR